MASEVDRHRLVLDAEHRRRVAVGAPAEALEEADVRHLDLRDHAPPAELARGANREAHEQRADVQGAVCGQHRQAVALPQPVAAERIQADRADDLGACQAERVFCQARLTTSLPTWPSNNLANARRARRVFMPAR